MSEGPQSTQENVVYANLDVITFTDLRIMKQIIEKGFRNNLFVLDESKICKVVLAKIDNIISKEVARVEAEKLRQEKGKMPELIPIPPQ